MKKRSLATYVFQKDGLYNRIDLHRLIAHLISLVVVVWWSFVGASDTSDLIARGAVSGIFIVIGRLILGRMGTSRLADVFITSTALALLSSFALSEIMLVNVFAVCALLLQEYFISPKKHVAAGVATATGVIIGLANGLREALMVLVATVLLARIASYVLQRQLSKKAFVFFGFKSICMILIIWVVSAVTRYFYDPSFVLPSTLPGLDIPLWLGVILVIFAIRGLWATMLLKTKRSPSQRALRLFYVELAIVIFVVVGAISRYGGQIFLPNILAKFELFGLAKPSMVVSACCVLAASLLVGAGIDRSLILSNHRTRSIAMRLGLVAPLSKVSHKK